MRRGPVAAVSRVMDSWQALDRAAFSLAVETAKATGSPGEPSDLFSAEIYGAAREVLEKWLVGEDP